MIRKYLARLNFAMVVLVVCGAVTWIFADILPDVAVVWIAVVALFAVCNL